MSREPGDDGKTVREEETESLRRRLAELDHVAPRAANQEAWSAELFRVLVAHADEHSIFTINLDGRVATWNEGAERLFGYRAAEIVGQDAARLYPPEAAAAGRLRRELERARTDGTAESGDWRIRKDGGRFFAQAITTPLYGSDGELCGYCRVVRDMTRRNHAEEALEGSERRFRLFVDNCPTVNFIKDEAGRFLYVDNTWKRRFSTVADEWVGRADEELWPHDISVQFRERDCAAFEADGPVESLEAIPSAGRTAKWLFLRFPFRDSSGQRLLGGIGVDVTEQEEARERIRQLNEELEARVAQRTADLTSANEELNSFCYSVSHDLRAPLRGIDGFSDALLEDYADRLDDRGRDYLHRVRAEAQRMGQLIDDLLALSRVARTELQRSAVDLSAIARSVAETLKQREPERHVEFVLASGLEAPGDERLLRIVLENLFGNAWKFTSRLGQARIEFGETLQPDGVRAWFVRDNGVGFNLAFAEQLFGAFQRLHPANEFPGTGIGLATVQRIIHRHGGQVWADARPGDGATFYFTLGASSNSASQTLPNFASSNE